MIHLLFHAIPLALFHALLAFMLIMAMPFCPVIAQTLDSQSVRLATLDWEPYIGQSLRNKGYVAEIVLSAFKRAGLDDIKIDFLPWNRALSETEKGNYDGLFPEYYDANRLAKFTFSEPFPGGPLGFYKRKDNKITFQKLEGLQPYRIGVVRGYINTKEFDEAAYLTKDEAKDDETNIKKLYYKRVDLIVIDRFVANYIISTKFPAFSSELEFLEPPLEVKPLYIAFAKAATSYEDKLRLFNLGLKSILDDGTVDKIMLDHGFARIERLSEAVQKP